MQEMNNNLDSEVVFLSGPPRSGTTWLQREVCNENTIQFFPECTLLTQQIELYSKTLNYCEEKRFKTYFSNKDILTSYYQDNVKRMAEMIGRINNSPTDKFLILKDPGLSLYLNELRKLFTKSKIILLVRDPRDVLASMKNVIARKNKSWDIKNVISQIFNHYFIIENYQINEDEDCLVIRYEDLITGGLQPVQSFLGNTGNNKISNENTLSEMERQLNKVDPFHSEYRFKPTTKERIGSYREYLSAIEIAEVESVFSGVIMRWGY